MEIMQNSYNCVMIQLISGQYQSKYDSDTNQSDFAWYEQGNL